tara:strand:+ start:492 stop:2933 length:2442 start_codon:yes stop_codon:yes gene_type:complete
MANGNLIQQAQKMYESELDTTDYAKLLTEPAVKAMGDMLKTQRVKTEALMAAMPAGVNISKVPEELRGKVTAYLTENKAAYTEAAKVVASGIKPTDQRYIDAIETMNRVRGGFEALDASLVNIAKKRKAALESRDNISAGAHDHDSILHEKWSNGSIYNDFTLEDGNFYYTDHENNKVNANDYAGAMQQSTGITDGMVAQSDRARELGNKGYSFEEEEGNFRGSINSMLKNAGKNGRVDFAYSGVYGVEETPFIDTYIKDRLNLQKHDDDGSGDISQAEFDKWHAYYKNEDFSAGTEMGDKLREYLIGTLRNSYDSGVTAKEEANREARERKFDKPEIYGAYRTKKDIDDMNEAIKNRDDFVVGFDNKKYTYNPDTDKYEHGEEIYSADDLRRMQKIYGYKTGEDPTPDTQITDDDEVKIPKVAIEDVITESNLEVIEEEKSGKFIKYYSYSGNSITDADAALEAAKNAGIEDAFLIYENNGKKISLREYSRLEDKSNVTFKVQLGVGEKSMKVEGTDVEGTEVEGTEVEETDIEETDVDETEVEEVEAEGTTEEEIEYGPNNPDPMTGTPNTSGDMILNESGKYVPIDSKEGKRIAANYGSAQEKNEERIEGTEYGPDNPDPMFGSISTDGTQMMSSSGDWIDVNSEAYYKDLGIKSKKGKDFVNGEGVMNKVNEIASNHGFNVRELLNVIQKESNFDPAAVNKKSGATGLIQFFADRGKDYKTIGGTQYKIADIKKMPIIEQLDLINKYFEENHKYGQHPYITIAYPKAHNMEMDEIIAKSDSAIARQNPVWVNDEGNVTKRSIIEYVEGA